MFNFPIILLLVVAFSTCAMGVEPPLVRSISPLFPADVRFGGSNELFILGPALGGLTTGRSSSLVWLDNATNSWRQFRRNSQVVMNDSEIGMTIVDVSQDGRTALLRHSLRGQDPSEQLRLPVGSPVRKEMRLFEVATGNQSSLQDGPWRNLGPMSPRERGVGYAEFTLDSKLLWTPKRWWDITAKKVVLEPWMQKISDELSARNTLNAAGRTHNLTGGPLPPSRYFSPDGRLFFLPGKRLPEAIEMSSGRIFTSSNKLEGQTSAIENWAFSPDMKYLVTLSADGEFIKWDLTHKDVDWPK